MPLASHWRAKSHRGHDALPRFDPLVRRGRVDSGLDPRPVRLRWDPRKLRSNNNFCPDVRADKKAHPITDDIAAVAPPDDPPHASPDPLVLRRPDGRGRDAEAHAHADGTADADGRADADGAAGGRGRLRQRKQLQRAALVRARRGHRLRPPRLRALHGLLRPRLRVSEEVSRLWRDGRDAVVRRPPRPDLRRHPLLHHRQLHRALRRAHGRRRRLGGRQRLQPRRRPGERRRDLRRRGRGVPRCFER